jgi:hypothetical protein
MQTQTIVTRVTNGFGLKIPARHHAGTDSYGVETVLKSRP